MPDGSTFMFASAKARGGVPSAKKRFPLPSRTGRGIAASTVRQKERAMRTLRNVALAACGMFVVVSPLLAHHEWPVDRTRVITMKGAVAAYRWANPHVMIDLDVEANGTIEKWTVGGSSPQFMTTCGWNKKTLTPGRHHCSRLSLQGRIHRGPNADNLDAEG